MFRNPSILASVVAAWWLMAMVAVAQDASKPGMPIVPVVVLKRGETRELQLGWDKGVSRGPANFVGTDPVLSKEMLAKRLEGHPRWQKDGVTVEYDEKASQALNVAFHKDGRYTGKSKEKPYARFSAFSYRITAASDAKLSSYTIYVHSLSGSGSNMWMEGEFRVLVIE